MTRNNRRWASYTLRAAPAGIKGVVMTLVASLLIGSAAVAQSQSATSPESDAESDGQPAIQDTNETATIERLEGEAWQLQEYLTVAGLKPAVSDTGNRYAEFSDGRFRLNAGCNTLNGSYWLDGSRLIFSPHVTSLLQDCTDTLMTQEQSLLRLLAKVERFGKRDGSMALMDAQGLVLMTLSRPDAVPLQGRLWRLQAYRNYDDTVVTALTDPPFTLWFENAANLTGDACDTYRAVFTRDDRSLRLIGPIAASRRGCIGSPAATRQSTEYMAALSKVDSYRVDAKALLLRDKDGRMLASFTAIDDISQGRDQIGNGARDQGKTDEGPQLLPRPPLR